MLECMKGYEIRTISKRKASKENFGTALNGVISQETLRGEVLKALEGKGKVFGLYSKKEKEFAACYIFEKDKVKSSEVPYQKIKLTKENVWEFIKTGTAEGAENGSEEDEGKEDKDIFIYRLTGQYSIGLPEDVIQIFEKWVIANLKEYIMVEHDDAKFFKVPEAIIWNDTMLRPSRVSIGSSGYISAVPLGIGVGAALGVVLDSPVLGISLGFLWAIVFGMAFTTSGTAKETMPILVEEENNKSNE